MSSQGTITWDMALLSWGQLNTACPCENKFLSWLVHAVFALPIELSLAQPTSYLIFSLSIPLGCKHWEGGGSEQLTGTWLPKATTHLHY